MGTKRRNRFRKSFVINCSERSICQFRCSVNWSIDRPGHNDPLCLAFMRLGENRVQDADCHLIKSELSTLMDWTGNVCVIHADHIHCAQFTPWTMSHEMCGMRVYTWNWQMSCQRHLNSICAPATFLHLKCSRFILSVANTRDPSSRIRSLPFTCRNNSHFAHWIIHVRIFMLYYGGLLFFVRSKIGNVSSCGARKMKMIMPNCQPETSLFRKIDQLEQMNAFAGCCWFGFVCWLCERNT